MKNGLIAILTLLAHVAFSQVFQASVNVDYVYVGEQFSLEIITDQPCEIELDKDFGGLNVLAGPFKSYMNSSSNINGVTTNTSTTTFTYTLSAPRKGSFTIPAAIMRCDDHTYKTQPIKVVAGNQSDVLKDRLGDEAFFYAIEVNKTSVYPGEPFILKFFLYCRKMPTEIQAISIGQANGLWRGDITETGGSKNTRNVSKKTIDGDVYHAIELKKEVCIASTPGKLIIEPYYGSALKEIDFFNVRRLDGNSNELEIEVKPLPTGAPDDYMGLVGDFELEHMISKTSLSQHQLFELSIQISGVGNFSILPDIFLSLPPSFEVMEPEKVSETTFDEYGERGKVEFKFMIRPTEAGKFKIRPFSTSYFDLKSGVYRKISTEEFEIIVKEESGAVVEGPDQKEDVEVVATDITHILTEKGSVYSPDELLFGSLTYWSILLGPLFISLLISVIRLKKANRTDEEKKVVEQKSSQKSIFKDLSSLEKSTLEQKEILGKLKQSLTSYLRTQLELNLSDLSVRTIEKSLVSKGCDTLLAKDFCSTWNELEMAQYAPISSSNLSELIAKIRHELHQINQQVK